MGRLFKLTKWVDNLEQKKDATVLSEYSLRVEKIQCEGIKNSLSE